MRKINFLAATVLALGLTACSSDSITPDTPAPDAPETASISFAPTRAAQVAAYSNGYRAAKQSADIVTITGVAPLANDVLESNAKVFMDILPEEQDNLNLSPSKPGVTDWTTNYLYVSNGKPFVLYPAYSVTGSHDIIGIYYYDDEGVKHEENIFDNTPCPWGYYKNQNGIQITVAKGYKFGFYLYTTYAYNRQDRYGDYVGNVAETFYSNVSENSTICSKETHYWLWDNNECHGKGVHSASFNYGGNTFFGFEDWEFNNTTAFDLNDVVFMVTPALDVKDNPTEDDKKPVDPAPTPDPVVPDEPKPDPTPSVVAGNGSVEVNFSINDRQYDSNDTKLSIHVRDTTDVTLFIPTPADYYCPVDDMLIVQKHDIAQTYNTTNTVDMNINGNAVSLTTTYSKDGITITTKGINADVLKYLRNTYGDGLTFEINSYFNTERVDKDGNKVPVTRDELQALLNKTTISFTQTPKFYLNAFGVIDGSRNPNDCRVTPLAPSLFGDMTESDPEHGTTSYLYIWERK